MEGWLSELWTAASKAGPFSTMLLGYILYMVNEERKAERKRNDTLTERVMGLATDANKTLSSLEDTLSTARGKRTRDE